MLSCRTPAVLRRLALHAHQPTRMVLSRRVGPSSCSSVIGQHRVRLFSVEQEGASDSSSNSIHPSSTTASAALHSIDEDTDDDMDETELGDGDGFSSSPQQQRELGLNKGGESIFRELNKFYLNQHGQPKTERINKLSEHFQTEKHYHDEQTEFLSTDRWNFYWEASFTCPLAATKPTVYQAGTLRTARDEFEARRRLDGCVVYRKKSVAVIAAAAQALDVIQYRKLGIVEPRFCEEDPSLWGMEEQEVDVNLNGADGSSDVDMNFKRVRGSQVLNNSDEPAAAVTDEGDRKKFVSRDTADTVTDESGNQNVVSNDNTETDESEYVLWEIPRNNGRPPYQRIVEALSNRASTLHVTTPNDNSMLPIPLSPEQHLILAVDNANSWLRQVNGMEKRLMSPHRLMLPRQETPSTLLMGNILLSAMADASQNAACSLDQSWEAEKAAKKIIDVLWETQDSTPDTESYNSYLRCMRSISPKAAATKAENIVSHMRNGTPVKGRILPKPNTGTINTLIQMWAQVGGTSGRYGKNLDEDFVPNRESFLSVLSSSAYNSEVKDDKGGFDPEFARQCLQRMKELSDEDPDNASLRPDTQLYNAPLRWSGGMSGRKTRPYARSVVWDNYKKIFFFGFRIPNDDDDLVQEARSMEEWMKEMTSHEDDAVTPDIETFEAVIQAWVRVGSRAGLERAENLAETLLTDSADCSAIRPRLQTFHPILSAWINSKDPEGANKFQQWVDRLEAASDLIPAVRPDGRIFGSQITVHVSSQLLLLDGLGDTPLSECDDESRDKILVAANACNETLEKQCAFLDKAARTGVGVDRILEVTSFAHTVQAWSNVALVNQATDNTELFEDAVSQMKRVIDSFESLVTTISEAEVVSEAEAEKQSKEAAKSSVTGLQAQQELSLQLRHMVVNAHRIYSAFAIGFRRLQNGQTAPQDSSDEGQYNPFVGHIYFVERMLRRVGEFYEIEAHDQSLKMRRSEKTYLFQGEHPHGDFFVHDKRNMAYADLFSYLTPDVMGLPRKNEFLVEVAYLLKESPLSLAPAGDIMRLALLIKDVANRTKTTRELETLTTNLVGLATNKLGMARARSLPQGSDAAGGADDDGVVVSSQRSPPRATRHIERRAGGTQRRARPIRKKGVTAN